MMDRMIKEEWRLNLLSKASGNVLEVGIGTGTNLLFYPNRIDSLTGIDFSKGMLKHAEEKVYKRNFFISNYIIGSGYTSFTLSRQYVFDTIVSTCVFCSVPNPIVGLKELRRVCKPTGRIMMLEHMRSDNKLMGVVMDMLNPLTDRALGGQILIERQLKR